MIRFDEAKRLAHISCNNMSYLFFITEEGSVRSLYWGGPIDKEDAFRLGGPAFHSSFDHDIQAEREEYPLWNGHSFTLPCLKVQGDAGRAVFPVYEGHELVEKDGESLLDILLADNTMGISVRLRYRLFEDCGILCRSAVISAQKAVRLDTAMSASASLPFGQESRARFVTGKWAGEFQITEEDIKTGVLTLQSRQGVTGHHFNPAIALGEPTATETAGRVWFAALGYSGNWAIHVEKSIFGNTHLVAGIHDFDFEMNLAPGDVFETPPLYIGLDADGYGGMSRRMHRFVRKHILPSDSLMPVLYNSWEATAFHVQAEQQMRLADKAARIGCELFVVDDGWFGMRNSDAAGLGDWWVNRQKFPGGLDPLIDHVKSRGMKFGIWVEPESVNPDSDLYRSHPDWIYRYPDAKPLTLRNQYLLNLSIAQVREYLREMLYELLSNHDISFLKWDMNRAVTDMQSLPNGKGKELWYGHVKAVYGLLEELRKAFPNLAIEACSGGGGRVDLGILRYAAEAWPSDNTDPYTRLFIQDGFSQFYPPAAMMCWVTDSPGGKEWSRRPLAYRFHSAMCGSLGIGADISRFSEEELKECAFFIKQYKAWRHIIQNGELYRLVPPGAGPMSAVQYVSSGRDEALVFLFVNHPSTDAVSRIIRLQGLSLDARYITDTGETYAGSTLMNAGLCCPIEGDFISRAIHLKKLRG